MSCNAKTRLAETLDGGLGNDMLGSSDASDELLNIP